MSKKSNSNRPMLLAALAAIGASACCLGPLVLLSLGIGGAWMSNLTAMEAYSSYFTFVLVIILAVTFRKLYLVPQNCEEGSLCANPKVLRNQRILFWISSVIFLLMVAFPYYGALILG